MADKKEPDDPDRRLWEAAMSDVKRLPRKASARGTAKSQASPAKGAKKVQPAVRETVMTTPEARKTTSSGKGLDRRSDERLRRGKMVIEGRIDLHGFRLKEAQAELTKELLKHFEQGRRCILVITGKGKENPAADDADWWETKPGLLRKAAPGWLKEEKLANIVLQTHTAKQQDGGEGAMYVLLRRKR